jgi:hypothetical protein
MRRESSYCTPTHPPRNKDGNIVHKFKSPASSPLPQISWDPCPPNQINGQDRAVVVRRHDIFFPSFLVAPLFLFGEVIQL